MLRSAERIGDSQLLANSDCGGVLYFTVSRDGAGALRCRIEVRCDLHPREGEYIHLLLSDGLSRHVSSDLVLRLRGQTLSLIAFPREIIARFANCVSNLASGIFHDNKLVLST